MRTTAAISAGVPSSPASAAERYTVTAKCTSETNWDETCRWNPFGGGVFAPLPVMEPAPVTVPIFNLPPISPPIPGFGFGFVS